jgi:hypothetical protein
VSKIRLSDKYKHVNVWHWEGTIFEVEESANHNRSIALLRFRTLARHICDITMTD